MNTMIRKMSAKDVDRIVQIEEQSFTTPWSKDSFLHEVKHNSLAYYSVAELDNNVVGYAGMWLIIDEAHITNVAVDPSYRRQGIAQQLMSHMFEIAKRKNVTAMTLEVRVSNIGAIRLYEKLDFALAGLRRGYYEDTGEDAMIMWKQLGLIHVAK